jgi:hypothetical protein
VERLIVGEQIFESSNMPKKKPAWRDSAEKESLRKAVASGEISTDTKKTKPKDVFRPEFALDGSYVKFGSRLRSLQATVGKAQTLAAHDYALLQTDLEDNPKTGSSNGKPRWDGSAAEMFLRVAVADGADKAVKPAALRASEAAYGEFDGTVFRDHIYQERKTQKYVKDKFPKSHEKMVQVCWVSDVEGPLLLGGCGSATTTQPAAPSLLSRLGQGWLRNVGLKRSPL